MTDYIHFFKKNNTLICHIFDSSLKKSRIIKNPNNINLLLSILKNYGYSNIKENFYITQNVPEIHSEYTKKLKVNKNKLKIYTTFKEPFSLKKINKTTKKRIFKIFLVSALVIYILNSKKDSTIEPNPIIETPNLISKDNFSDNNITEENIDNSPSFELAEINDFKYSFENRTETEAYTNTKKYEDIFKKYGQMYGIDYHILMAIAAQESGGDHYNNLEANSAKGIMQIEESVYLNTLLTAYNFLSNSKDSIIPTSELIADLDTNIKIGTIILQNILIQQNYNIPLALQTYNFGPGNIQKVLEACSSLEEIDINLLLNNDYSWMNYREFLNVGDPLYIEHIFSYIPTNIISVTTPEGKIKKLQLSNEYSKTKTL